MKKLLPLVLLVVFCVGSAEAQSELHFSQFFASPLTINPAMAGAIEANMRAYVNYRNQWSSISSGYKTISASFDKPFYLKNKDKFGNSFFGGGLSVVSDKAGVTGYNTTEVALSGSYALDLGGTRNAPDFISAGFQLGYRQISVDINNASWETQWNGIAFDPSLSNGETTLPTASKSILDVGAGVLWYHSLDDYKRLLLGASMLQANRPKVGVLYDRNALYRKVTVSAQMSISSDGSGVTFWPSALYEMEGPSSLVDIGGEIEFEVQQRTEYTNFKNNISFNVGTYYRSNDAIYFVGRVNYYDFSIGMSYDVTTSSLSVANNGNGATEVVLQYRPKFSGPGAKRQKLPSSKGL